MSALEGPTPLNPMNPYPNASKPRRDFACTGENETKKSRGARNLGSSGVEAPENEERPLDEVILLVGGLGFRDSDFGLRVWGVGFRVWGLGFGVGGWGFGLGVWGLGFGV